MRTDFAILGFPKCGTTGLARNLDTCDDIVIHRGEDRNWEYPLFAGGEETDKRAAARVGHKYAYYAHKSDALAGMRRANSDVLGIICLRDPVEILFSWWQMHRKFAIDGAPNHFTNKTDELRAFYAECSIEEYYQREKTVGRFNFSRALRNVAQAGFRKLIVTDQRQIEERGGDVLNRIRAKLALPMISVSNDTLRPQAPATRGCLEVSDFVIAELRRERRKMIPYIARWTIQGKTFLSPSFKFRRLI